METPATHIMKECDLVMKGGVTSGIVYPSAIINLSKEYIFRSIGGTSAGAIAAAVTAAAEYGREKNGFSKLDEVSKKLSEAGFLEGLFQPSGETAPLLETLKALQKASVRAKSAVPEGIGIGFRKKAGMLTRALKQNDDAVYKRGAFYGLLTGAGLALLLAALAFMLFWLSEGEWNLTGSFVLFAVLALPLCFIAYYLGGVLASCIHFYKILTVEVPENFFGLCSGRKATDNPAAQPEVLTDWLSLKVDELAGLPETQRPLTFGLLEEKKIRLMMMTSNLSQSQPYVIPFENNKFIFNRQEFAQLFPENIVEHLIEKSHQSETVRLPQGYYFLPPSNNLPVTVALRMSLSFPVLISAVPLYTVSLSAFARSSKGEQLQLEEEDLMLNWFSDGGISSNFPIQFFDSWLPRRPTFGIKLEALPPEALNDRRDVRSDVKPEYISVTADDVDSDSGGEDGDLKAPIPTNIEDSDLRKTVYLPKANSLLTASWKPFTKKPSQTGKGMPLSLTKFAWAIFDTAQNFRDNMQSALPSYRERIVQIRLSEDEGGLNLMMPGPVVDKVMKKGQLAAEVIQTQFNFDHHQWVRFRVLMAQLEENLMRLKEILGDDSQLFDLERLMTDQLDKQNRFPYRRDEAWCKKAGARVSQLRQVIAEWERPVFGQEIPRPEPALRVTPEI